MGADETNEDDKASSPSIFAALGGMENLTDRREMFPVEKKMI